MTLDGPSFSPDLPWFRGNLHSHTTESDGRESPARVMEQYRRLGYDFLAISDHDILTRVDPEEVPDGLTMIPSLEAGVGPHVLCVDVDAVIPKMSDRQAVIDRTREAGGITVLNHPNWGRGFSHWDQDAMEALDGYAGIEIYNGVIEILEGSPYALDRWDRLLTAGKRVWGFAHDDSHATFGVGLGWIMVQAASNTREHLMDAIRGGRFYASTGVTVRSLELEADSWTVEGEAVDRIRFVGAHGRLLALADAETGNYMYRAGNEVLTEALPSRPAGALTARYRFQEDEPYVRCELLGRGGRCAWTQPVWVQR